MDFDALVLFHNNFINDEFKENDISIMISSLINGGIDVNRSVNDNIVQYAVYTKDQSALSMLNREENVLNLPIYRVLLTHEEFFNTIKLLIKKRLFNNTSFLDLVECLVESLLFLDEIEEARVLNYLVDIFNSKGRIGIDYLQESIVLRSFVKDNLHALNLEKHKRLIGNDFYKKILIIKLLSFGAVCFGDKNDISISYEDVMIPLIRTQNYSRLKVLMNSKAIPFADCDYVKNLVDRYISYNLDKTTDLVEIDDANVTLERVESALSLIKTAHVMRNM